MAGSKMFLRIRTCFSSFSPWDVTVEEITLPSFFFFFNCRDAAAETAFPILTQGRVSSLTNKCVISLPDSSKFFEGPTRSRS